HFLPDLYRADRQQRYRLDLNQDLSKFRGRNERRESKWDLDSRNVPYGIFSATPKKRAKWRPDSTALFKGAHYRPRLTLAAAGLPSALAFSESMEFFAE